MATRMAWAAAVPLVLLETADGNADPSAMIGDTAAQVLAVSPPDALQGVRRMTVQLPDGTVDGSSVVLAVGDIASQAGVTIRVQ